MLKLKENLGAEKQNSVLLRAELAQQKAKEECFGEMVAPNERLKFIEQQVKQLSYILAQRSRERSLKDSQIVKEYQIIKGNYDQALMMIGKLKVQLAQKLTEHLATP